MDHHERQEKIRDAQRRLRAQRRRAGTLRGRVVVISLITFVLLWGVVFTQMATGNDPVLGDSSGTLASNQRQGGRAGGGSAAEAGAGTDAVEGAGSETKGSTESPTTEEPGEEAGGEAAVEEALAEEAAVEEALIEEAAAEEALAPLTTSQS